VYSQHLNIVNTNTRCEQLQQQGCDAHSEPDSTSPTNRNNTARPRIKSTRAKFLRMSRNRPLFFAE